MVQLGGFAARMGLSILIVFILAVALLKTTLGLIVAVIVSTPVILGLAIFMAMMGAATFTVLLFLPILVPLCMTGQSIMRYLLGAATFMVLLLLGAATFMVLLFLPILVPLCMTGESIIRYNIAILKAELHSVKETFGPGLHFTASCFKLCILLLTEAFKVMSVSRETTLFPRDWRVCKTWLCQLNNTLFCYVVPNQGQRQGGVGGSSGQGGW